MRIDDLARALDGLWAVGDTSVDVVGVTHDSRRVERGWLFACLVGENADGHDFAAAAVDAGATALLVGRPLDLGVPQIVAADTRTALGPVSARLFGDPSASLTVVGVTGTNGKTMTVHLLASVLEAGGRSVETVGTLTGVRTTPEASDLQRRMATARDAGTTHVAMEVSSHALAQARVAGTRFAVAAFTNLTRDHLDYHGTVEEYFAAKSLLFEPDLSDRAIVNADDPRGRLLIDAARIPTTGYRLGDVGIERLDPARSRFSWRGHTVDLPFGGRFNVANALCAGEIAVVLGVDEPTVAEGLAAAGPVPGRMEAVDAGQPFTVLVDYAHTPDGLEHVLQAVAETTPGRVAVVFGCGGDRDATKRGPMGEIAARNADLVVVTTDNPRAEDPAVIAAAIVEGARGPADVVEEPDRAAAIFVAVSWAEPGDAIVIAGKGHETAQIFADGSVPFDDRAVASDILVRGAR